MNEKKHHRTAPEGRVSVKQKIGFGIGSVASVLGSHSISNLAHFVLNIGLGVNPVLVGLAQTIPRIWDAVSDPLVGHLSDNTRSRWGRRRPYIFVGSILTGILFALLWALPEGWSEKAYFAYFLGMSLLYYTALTIFMVPWGALGLEMSRDYHEKTRIQAVANFFGNVGAIAMPWLFALTQLDVFENELQGARVVGIGMGVVLCITGLVPALVCREKERECNISTDKVRLIEGLRITLTNRIFLLLMISVFLAATSFFIVCTLSPYIIIYHVMGGDFKAASFFTGINGTAWVVSAIIFVAPVTWAATHFGKKVTFILFLVVNLLGHVSKIWCYNPAHPWLVVIPPALVSAGFVSLWMVGLSMIADICDLDELKTGNHRSGSYQAVYGWIVKTGISVSTLISGILLVKIGFDADLTVQFAETILWLRVLEAAIPALATAAAIAVITRYPLSESRVYEIREALEQRSR
jgi:glycoside/pentoside/hexuronide:cation symporter, GPH family